MTLKHLPEAIYVMLFNRSPAQIFLLSDEDKRHAMGYVRRFLSRHADIVKVARPTRH